MFFLLVVVKIIPETAAEFSKFSCFAPPTLADQLVAVLFGFIMKI
jgi:hypothetical protein